MYVTEEFNLDVGMRQSGKCTMCGHNEVILDSSIFHPLKGGSAYLIYECKACGYTEFYRKKYAIEKKKEKKKGKSKKVSHFGFSKEKED